MQTLLWTFESVYEITVSRGDIPENLGFCFYAQCSKKTWCNRVQLFQREIVSTNLLDLLQNKTVITNPLPRIVLVFWKDSELM